MVRSLICNYENIYVNFIILIFTGLLTFRLLDMPGLKDETKFFTNVELPIIITIQYVFWYTMFYNNYISVVEFTLYH